MEQKKLGQYFTTDLDLKNKIYEFIKNKPYEILEPCIGRGDLIIFIKQKLENIKFDMYEIDEKIEIYDDINKNEIIRGDFLQNEINKKYITIIGNPPYIKRKNGNIYIDFISKCQSLLENKGELIFIVPSDFFKLTSASKLLDEMMKNGTFTHIFHPHNERLFKEARIDVLLFRYCKDKELLKKCIYNNKTLNILNNNGLITFHNDEIKEKNISLKELFDIYVGVVSGRDLIYRNKELGNIKVLIKENILEDYICITKFPSKNDKINEYLLKNKEELINRKIRKFNENNWFEWGGLRNINKMIPKDQEDECIYISSLTRNEKVAFKYKVCFFGAQLIMLKPKKKLQLDKIVNYLNSNEYKKNFVFSGRFKIGQRQLENSIVPFKLLE
jgi:adenine-specific DNA-methyltransferase